LTSRSVESLQFGMMWKIAQGCADKRLNTDACTASALSQGSERCEPHRSTGAAHTQSRDITARPEPVRELTSLPRGGPAIDLAPHLVDFADTAAAVSLLDLIVMTDGAVAHLAGRWESPFGYCLAIMRTGFGCSIERIAPGTLQCVYFDRVRKVIGITSLIPFRRSLWRSLRSDSGSRRRSGDGQRQNRDFSLLNSLFAGNWPGDWFVSHCGMRESGESLQPLTAIFPILGDFARRLF
jgi:hypothetical protein